MKDFVGMIIQLSIFVLLVAVLPGIPPHVDFDNYKLEFKPLEGPLALNNRLNGAEKLFTKEVIGPEHLAVYRNELYTSTVGGYVQKIVGSVLIPVVKIGKPCEGHWESEICGRPLGFDFDDVGNIYIADAFYGLVKVNLKTGDKTDLVTMDEVIDGKNSKVPNSVAVSKSGLVYWTDSSTEMTLADGSVILLSGPSGRLLEHDPIKKTNRVLLDSLRFANGVVLTDDESALLVCETTAARVWKYHLKGKDAGSCEILLDGLPGFPDNINHFENGTYVVSLVSPSDGTMTFLARNYIFRRMVARIIYGVRVTLKILNELYNSNFWKKLNHWMGNEMLAKLSLTTPRGTAVIFDANGQILDSLHSTDNIAVAVSSLIKFNGYYYMGSPYNNYLARKKIE